jgi:transcriptional regulator with XRE-family HTH domain
MKIEATQNLSPEQFTQALQELGWKQSDFCRRVGLDKNTPSRWVLGKSPIPRWVGSYLGLVIEIERLHREYVAPLQQE